MKFKKIVLSIAAVGLLSMPSVASADDEDDDFSWLDRDTWGVETSGELIGKYGVYTGQPFGEPNYTHNPKQDANGNNIPIEGGDDYRSELTAKLFLNQEVTDDTSWHAGLQYNFDDSGVDGYRGPRQDSQFDWLREFYIDTSSGDMSWRLGKQQVVWGKADGVKFLDIINPTDYRHWGQDSMEDSRIPLWMVNGEYAINDNSSLQLIYVLQTDVTNQIPGLFDPETGDQGQPFVPLGMDTMLGQTNGFKNIGPQMGSVATAFSQTFQALLPNFAAFGDNILQGFRGMTVSNFTNQPDVEQFLRQTNLSPNAPSGYVDNSLYSLPGMPPVGTTLTGNDVLGATVTGTQTQAGKTTNLFNTTLNTSSPKTMFDYMGDTTFATFDTFQGMNTKYVRAHEDIAAVKGNIGLKYAGTNDDIGLNYTFNYYYHYDNNPVIDVSWEANGQRLTVDDTQVDNIDSNGAYEGHPDYIGTANHQNRTIKLTKADGTTYNANPAVDGPATMVFTEKQNRINTFGMSFDYAIDTSFAPIILRSEMVYDKDTLVPVVDLGKLAYGDLEGAFQNERADFFNYVVGLDVTVMTNLFVSFQFMDKWNLDYVDEEVQYAGNTKKYSKHTANPATMSLANGFKKAEEHQIMYTFFLSKPFLESDAMRVNNIFLYENENGGYWDRFDLEYSYSDNVILSAAVNMYGGDQYGVFGQFEQVSNAEVGFKYIF